MAFQGKSQPTIVNLHDEAYWDKLWDKQEKAIERAKTPPKDRVNGRVRPIQFGRVRWE